ncbi:MAG TPA: Hsp33 family molecular chaperone HslO [Haliangium sp.]|nr:Hsp33 family molecular chaperone HslO [Haliangium sp.]
MTDTIVRCVLRDPPLRVVAVTNTGVVREAARRHGAVGGAQVALGRGATCGLLLATLTKAGEQVTLQVLGSGPLGGLLVDATDAGHVRVSLKNPEVLVPGPHGQRVSVADGIGRRGVVSVARDLGMRFQSTGQSLIVSGEIDEDLEHYLTTSEQVDSALGCEVLLGDSEVTAAAGVLVQCMPGEDAAHVVAEVRERLRAGGLTALLARSMTTAASDLGSEAGSGIGPEADPVLLARALLGERGARLEVLDTRPVRFHCPCTRERVQNSLMLLDPAELESMVRDDEGAEVTCNFCREVYQLTASDLEALLAARLGREQT